MIDCSTLEQRAKRLFLTKGVPLGALSASLFAKSKSSSQEALIQKEIAQLEAFIYKYSELLGVSVDYGVFPVVEQSTFTALVSPKRIRSTVTFSG